MLSFVVKKFYLANSRELKAKYVYAIYQVTEEEVVVKVECCPPVDDLPAILEKR